MAQVSLVYVAFSIVDPLMLYLFAIYTSTPPERGDGAEKDREAGLLMARGGFHAMPRIH